MLSPSGGGRRRKDIKQLLLADEADEYSHLLEETIVKDNLKEDYLKKEGCRVLRFSDKDVLTDKLLPLPPPEGDNFSETIMSNQKFLKQTTLNINYQLKSYQ